MMPSLRDELVFYGSYHTNKWNQLIHFIFVPILIFSVLVWLAYIGPVVPVDTSALKHLPDWIANNAILNPGILVVIVYSALYVVWDVAAGLSWALCVALPLWLAANAFQQQVAGAWAYALGFFVLGWYMQIHPGHLVLEKRKPALVDGFVQAFATAPLFVWMELLFRLGYRPELKRDVEDEVRARLAVLRVHDAGPRGANAQEPLVPAA